VFTFQDFDVGWVYVIHRSLNRTILEPSGLNTTDNILWPFFFAFYGNMSLSWRS
jgi:hypothetical protein